MKCKTFHLYVHNFSIYFLAPMHILWIMLQMRAWRHVGFHTKYLALSHFNQEQHVCTNFSQCSQQKVPRTIRSAVPELLHADRQTICTWDTNEGRMTGWGMYWTRFWMSCDPVAVNTPAMICNTKILRQDCWYLGKDMNWVRLNKRQKPYRFSLAALTSY